MKNWNALCAFAINVGADLDAAAVYRSTTFIWFADGTVKVKQLYALFRIRKRRETSMQPQSDETVSPNRLRSSYVTVLLTYSSLIHEMEQ